MANRIYAAVGALLVLAGLFHLGVYAVLGGPWFGPVSWRKPFDFGVSFGLTLLAVVWVSSYLRLRTRTRVVLLGIFAVDCVAEVAGITIQAWRHVPSHFNWETPFSSGITAMLAVGGGVLIVVLGALAVAAFRGNPALAPSMNLALRAGFATLVIGLGSGAAMIARGVTLGNEGHPELAYTQAGFLKPLHAVSLHGVLVLPALAWLLSRLPLDERRRTRIVGYGVAAYGVAIVGALALSLR